MSNNGIQPPLFAPVTQQQQGMGDDIDLNEIFADYFINEFEDPLNAYTSSMANYSGAAAAVALAQRQQQVSAPGASSTPAPSIATTTAPVNSRATGNAILSPAPLLVSQQQQSSVPAPATQINQIAVAAPVTLQRIPVAATALAPSGAATGAPAGISITTGGIKTAYHAGVVAAAQAAQQQRQQPQQMHVIVQQPISNGAPFPGSAGEPAMKKMKQMQAVVGAPIIAQQPQPAPAPVIVQQAPAANIAQVPSNVRKGGLSGRLGFQMVGGQLAVPQRGVPVQLVQQQQQQQTVTAGVPGTLSVQQVAKAPTTGVTLPVGVGIRLGGVGGVAPATAAVARPIVGAPGGQYLMWTGHQALTGGISEQAIAERRQRNREHAKRSRVRKKFMLESLQEQVRALQRENVELRMLIQEKIPNHAQKIISECCSKNPLFSDPDFMNPAAKEKKKQETSLMKSDFSLIESLTSGQQNFVLSDPRLPDNPIVYASPGFYTLTGYTQEQVLGRNCRFLQGPGTDPRAVDIIRTAIANGSDATTCILNYKADGTPFWNQFFVAALRDSDNCIVNYVGVQCEVEPEAGASALEDKVNSVLPLQQKGENTDGEQEDSKQQ